MNQGAGEGVSPLPLCRSVYSFFVDEGDLGVFRVVFFCVVFTGATSLPYGDRM